MEALIRNIREDLAKATSKEEIEDIIKSDPEILYLLRVDLAFDLFYQAFMLGSDKDVIVALCVWPGLG